MADSLDLSPIPAPMQDFNEKHATLQRAATRLGLSLDHPGNWPAIAAEAGMIPPDMTDRETAYGTTARLSFQIKVF